MMLKRYAESAIRILSFLPGICVLLFAVGTLLRAGFLDYTDDDAGLLNDHFIASVVAKNMAQGHGWVTTGHETFPLNPESLNTGPTVVLPMALAIAVFGNHLTVPGLAMATLNVLLLFGLLYQSRRYWADNTQHALFVLGLLALFASLWPHGWYRAGGEVPSALLLANAALLLARRWQRDTRLRWQTALAAGLLAGLAATSKQLALFGCLGLALSLMLLTILQHRRSFPAALLFCLGMAVPSLLFFGYQRWVAASLDPTWWAGTEYFRTQLFERYSGWHTVKRYLNPELPLWPEVLNTFGNGLRTVREQLAGTSHWPRLWLLWPVLLISGLLLAWRQRITHPLPWLLAGATLPLLAWFFLIATASLPRYLLIGAYLSVLMILAAVVALSPRYRFPIGLGILILCLASNPNCTGWSTVPNSLKTALTWPTQPSLLYRSILDMSDYMEAHPELPVSMQGHWTINRLEYLSPRRNIFRNALNELASHAVFDEEAYLAAFPEVAQAVRDGHYASGRDHFLYPDTPARYHGRFRLENDIAINMLFAYNTPTVINGPPACSSIVYQNSHHVIVRCNKRDIEQITGGALALRPQIWMRPQRIYPNENEFF